MSAWLWPSEIHFYMSLETLFADTAAFFKSWIRFHCSVMAEKKQSTQEPREAETSTHTTSKWG